jgi:hypothetical protein
MGERGVAHRALVNKPVGKKPLGRLPRRRENNIKTYLKEMGCEGVNWTGLA